MAGRRFVWSEALKKLPDRERSEPADNAAQIAGHRPPEQIRPGKSDQKACQEHRYDGHRQSLPERHESIPFGLWVDCRARRLFFLRTMLSHVNALADTQKPITSHSSTTSFPKKKELQGRLLGLSWRPRTAIRESPGWSTVGLPLRVRADRRSTDRRLRIGDRIESNYEKRIIAEWKR